MATSTLIQYLQAGEAGDTMNRGQVETFLTAGTITAGDAVALDLSQTGANKALFVVEAPANANAIVIGVALDTVVGTAAAQFMTDS